MTVARRGVNIAALLLHASMSGAVAQISSGDGEQYERPRVEIYGRVITDIIHDFNQNNPDWFDVMRPIKLPAFRDEFGEDGRQYFSVRATRVGVRPTLPTALGEVRGVFDFDLFGVGRDAGRTMFHLDRAYVELGKFGAGQNDSPFMDIDVFPNSLEYWGPSGIVFFRKVQFCYMPIQGDSRVTIALEEPAASGDRGDDDDRVELQNVIGRFPWPDLSAEGRLGRSWGYIELAGILRPIYWDDLFPDDEFELDGSALGWGLSLSSTLNTTERDQVKLQVTYGEAIESYLDAPFDIGIELDPGDPRRPFRGVALPVFAMLAFYDHYWSDEFSTSLGYSRVDVDNSNGQAPFAFRTGQYALINLLYYPTTDVLVGGEFQWGRRDNAFDGFEVDDFRLQLSARYDWSFTFGKETVANDGK